MYKALVRSHLDYCDVIYHIPSIIHQPPLGMTLISLMEKVERIQYRAPLTGAWQGFSRSKIYDECRRVLQIHKIIYIYIYYNTLSYLKDKLPPYCREMFSGNIRNTLHAIICKSNKDVPSIGVYVTLLNRF